MIKILRFKSKPIFEQLQLEEALLRTNQGNWLIINEGSPTAIVMGISGKTEELVNCELTQRDKIPVIRRFSGGGTVVVDQDTLFVSWIFQSNHLPIQPFPEHILRWTTEFYQKALPIPNFSLTENDYTIGHLKCGGNAQYLRKDRWLHHTTFLHKYDTNKMAYLLHPKKEPKYRGKRLHADFLTTLEEHLESDFSPADAICEKAKECLGATTSKELLEDFANHRKSTQFVEL